MPSATIRRMFMTCAMALAVSIAAVPAFAQTGQIKGKVVDAQGNPVDGAKIVLHSDQTNRNLETKTKKNGEYIQVGLAPGKYKVTATKGDLSQTLDVDIHLEMANLDFKLTAAGGGTMSKEEAAKNKAKGEAATKAFNDGVELSNAGKTDEAIAKFNEVIAVIPTCAECYANIGTVQTRAQKYDEAEAAYKKAIELKADFPDAYNGLANLYNSQKKFDQAAEASKKAMELSAASGGAAGAAGTARGRPRRRGGSSRGRQRIGGIQPGRHPVECEQVPRGEGPVRTGGQARSEYGRSAVLARHGGFQHRRPARREAEVRGVSQARADR